MRTDLLKLLECPFCAAELRLEKGRGTGQVAGEIETGILLCDCCAYPIVGGIPFIRTGREAEHAMKLIGAGKQRQALNTLLGLDENTAEPPLDEARTFEDTLGLLDDSAEARYLLYRFSDPTFLASEAVLTTVAREAAECPKQFLDFCGGSGHLTRSLLRLKPLGGVVLADLAFWKLYLAKRFVAPGCQPVCCNGNDPLPFKRQAFASAACTDAFHYIWSKRQLASELRRVVDADGTVVLAHVHNALSWNPSQGMPLSPTAYARLFEGSRVRVFAEAPFLNAAVNGSEIDLRTAATSDELDAAPALVVIAAATDAVFRKYAASVATNSGTIRLNPLYGRNGAESATWERKFPSSEYADEYAACMAYLPEHIHITPQQLSRWQRGERDAEASALMQRRVLLDLPPAYLRGTTETT
jgi:uncharacterized protein YbaR (Trm112 family)